MGVLALIFGDSVYKLYSRIITILLRIKGVKVGRNFFVLGKLKLKIRGKYSNIIIGDHVQFMGEVDLRNREEGKIIIEDRVKIDHGVRMIAANQATIKIGRESKVMLCTSINAGEDITIGNKSGIAAFCLVNSSSHKTEYGLNYMDQDYIHSPIVIGDGVQLGSHSTILPGVEIGREAMISTHSVVINDVSTNVVVGGVPARVLGKREAYERSFQRKADLSATTENTKNRLLDIFAAVFPSIATSNDEELNLLSRDDIVEWDSLNQLRLLAVIEQEFDIKISDEDAIQFISFLNVLNFLTNNT